MQLFDYVSFASFSQNFFKVLGDCFLVHLSIDLSGCNLLVPEHLLNRSNGHSHLEHERGECVPRCVKSEVPFNLRRPKNFLQMFVYGSICAERASEAFNASVSLDDVDSFAIENLAGWYLHGEVGLYHLLRDPALCDLATLEGNEVAEAKAGVTTKYKGIADGGNRSAHNQVLNLVELLGCEEAFLAVHWRNLEKVKGILGDDIALVRLVENCFDLAQSPYTGVVCDTAKVHPSVIAIDEIIVYVREEHAVAKLLKVIEQSLVTRNRASFALRGRDDGAREVDEGG